MPRLYCTRCKVNWIECDHGWAIAGFRLCESCKEMERKGMKNIQEAHNTTFHRVQEILSRKNTDYGGGKGEFHNFEISSQLTGIPVIQGILVRLSDKFARLNNILAPNHEIQVKEETIDDTIEDIVGYLAILRAYRSQQIESLGQIPTQTSPKSDINVPDPTDQDPFAFTGKGE